MAYKPVAGAQVAAPNVVPMCDIMLVLLIIFMVVTPMLQKRIRSIWRRSTIPANMPDADKDDAVIVAISASNDIYLLKEKTELSKIKEGVHDLIVDRVDKTVYVKSDGRAKYGDVVKVVDEIRSAGVENIGLITDKNEQRNLPPPPPPAAD